MKKYLLVILACLNLFKTPTYSQTIPYHDHVMIVILENKNYGSIIGSSDAPYLNSLLADSNCALLEKYFALTHPSQPNYVRLFSGDGQSVILDFDPISSTLPYTTENLGGSLLKKGYSFIGYSEDLPSVGYTGSDVGQWVRRHCPWLDWQDASQNGIPAKDNLPFTSFPSDYDSLPTLCWVIPNLDNDMHDGTVPQGDAWVKKNLAGYVKWAKTHNSLLIITFDETESYISNNKVPAIFIGQNVIGGSYSNTKYNHYDMLRTLEEMYGLPYAGESSSGNSIYEIWKNTVITFTHDFYVSDDVTIQIYPHPIASSATMLVHGLKVNHTSDIHLKIFDITGKEITAQMNIGGIQQAKGGDLSIDIDRGNLSGGTYFYEIINKDKLVAKDKFIIQ